jgi:hypothetical protein
MNVFAYEVEVVVTESGQQPREMCRVEHAYSLADAHLQAFLNVCAQSPPNTFVKLLRIGPPRRLVEAANRELLAKVDEALTKLDAAVERWRA